MQALRAVVARERFDMKCFILFQLLVPLTIFVLCDDVSACPSFASALIMASGSSCVPHTDCLGIDCHITVPENDFVSGDIDFSLTVSPQQRKVTITSGERVQEVTGDGE